MATHKVKTQEFTSKHLQHVARVLASSLRKSFITAGMYEVNLYGIPRGGVPSAYLLQSALEAFPYAPNIRIVEDPESADIIVDDIIDSGETMRNYKDNQGFAALCSSMAGAMPAHVFVGEQVDPGTWVVFPWEKMDHTLVRDRDLHDSNIWQQFLRSIGEDPERGGLHETPDRATKAWAHWTKGYAQRPEEVLKSFEDGAEHYDQMVCVRNIPVYSHCEHHLAAIFGVAHVAYVPRGRIVGLSKLNRVVDVFARRLQVQERLTSQIADALAEGLDPRGVAVSLECRHLCMESRGVCQQGHTTITTALRGVFLDDPSAKQEFLETIRNR